MAQIDSYNIFSGKLGDLLYDHFGDKEKETESLRLYRFFSPYDASAIMPSPNGERRGRHNGIKNEIDGLLRDNTSNIPYDEDVRLDFEKGKLNLYVGESKEPAYSCGLYHGNAFGGTNPFAIGYQKGASSLDYLDSEKLDLYSQYKEHTASSERYSTYKTRPKHAESYEADQVMANRISSVESTRVQSPIALTQEGRKEIKDRVNYNLRKNKPVEPIKAQQAKSVDRVAPLSQEQKAELDRISKGIDKDILNDLRLNESLKKGDDLSDTLRDTTKRRTSLDSPLRIGESESTKKGLDFQDSLTKSNLDKAKQEVFELRKLRRETYDDTLLKGTGEQLEKAKKDLEIAREARKEFLDVNPQYKTFMQRMTSNLPNPFAMFKFNRRDPALVQQRKDLNQSIGANRREIRTLTKGVEKANSSELDSIKGVNKDLLNKAQAELSSAKTQKKELFKEHPEVRTFVRRSTDIVTNLLKDLSGKANSIMTKATPEVKIEKASKVNELRSARENLRAMRGIDPTLLTDEQRAANRDTRRQLRAEVRTARKEKRDFVNEHPESRTVAGKFFKSDKEVSKGVGASVPNTSIAQKGASVIPQADKVQALRAVEGIVKLNPITSGAVVQNPTTLSRDMQAAFKKGHQNDLAQSQEGGIQMPMPGERAV